VAGYRVRLSPAADRLRRRLHGRTLIALRGVILALADDPRPPGATKLGGRRDLWRMRVRIDGRAWRIVYQARERERFVIVTGVAPRDKGTYLNV
jgi:mRNA interferase RelE/StbE